MKPSVDQKKCIGCGACASLCPGTFKMGSDGKSHVIGDCKNCDCKHAAETCPVGAISLK